jgi:uncharacterized peroxidase-related enzyme
MSKFNTHSIQTAPAAARPLLEGARGKYGFVPNLLGGFAESPPVLQAYLDLGGLFDQTALTPVERQVVLIAASAENHCTYCVAAHSTIARRMVKADGAVVEALRELKPLPDQKLQALAVFTRAVVEQRGRVAGQALDNFIAAGYTPAQVLDVVLGVAMKTLSNYANHIMGTPLDAAFQAEAWDQPVACGRRCA